MKVAMWVVAVLLFSAICQSFPAGIFGATVFIVSCGSLINNE